MTEAVLFVDVDGPLAPRRSAVYAQPRNKGKGSIKVFDPVAVAAVLYVLRESGAKIVVSSEWGRVYTKEEVFTWFGENGISFQLFHEDWVTPRTTRDRSAQIREWLTSHPEAVRYAVIDDEDLDVPNLVRVTMDDGLLLRHQEELERLLIPDRVAS